MLRRIMIATAAMLFAGAAQAPVQAEVRGVTDNEIIVGGAFPLTGNLAHAGLGHTYGLRVAVGEVNANGGINGRKLRLILEDDAYVPARAVQNIHKMIDVDKIFALVGMSSSGGALATLDYIAETGTVNVNGFILNDAIWSTPRPTTFSIGQGYPKLVESTVHYMDSKTPNLVWGVFGQDDAFGDSIISGMNKAMVGHEKSLAQVIKYKRGQTDFASEMLRMKSAGVNAIYVGGVFNEYLAIVREARRLGMDVQFGFLYSAHSQLLQSLMGDIGQGILMNEISSTLTEPEGLNFVEQAKKYLSAKELENITRDSLVGYSVGSLLISAIGACGRDVTKDCVVAALENTKDLKTLGMGPISFGKGVRFSDQRSRVLMNDFASKKFVPITPYQ